MLHSRFKPLLIIAFLMGVGIWLLSFGWSRLKTGQRLDQSAATVEGRVIDGSSHALSKGGQSMEIVVEYVPANHSAITRKFDVDSADYKAALESGKATVTYVPDAPGVSRVTRFADFPFRILVGLGGIMIFAGIVCLRFLRKSAPAEGGPTP